MKRLTLLGALLLASAGSAQETPSPPLAPGQIAAETGEAIYRQTCQGCHMADGSGAEGAASYPALAENPRLAAPDFATITVLFGRRNMPAFAPRPDFRSYYTPAWLSDEQVAQVVNYVRGGFGNAYPEPVTVEQVRRLREAVQAPAAHTGAATGAASPPQE